MNIEELLLNTIEDKFFKRPADFYIPNGAQLNFIKLFGGGTGFEKTPHTWVEADQGENFINFYVAANGTGKTDIQILISGEMIGACDNPYFRDSSGKLYPYYYQYPTECRGRIISTPDAIRKTIEPRLCKLFPNIKKEKRGHSDFYNYFEGSRGFFDLMTYGQEPTQFESATLNFVFFDEPPDNRDIFIATTARARKGMRIGFVMTPLKASAWLHDIVSGNTGWSVGSVYAQMEVNCRQHGLRGALEHKHLEEQAAGWSEEEREARVYARWMHLAGQVYYMFDRQIHVVSDFEIPREGTIYCAMDPHTRRPNVILWFKVCQNGRVYIIREYPEVTMADRSGKQITQYFSDISRSDTTYEEYCDKIKSVEDEIGVARDRVMDGRFGNTSYGDGSLPYYMEFNRRGVAFRCSPSDPYNYRGHNRVKSLLKCSNVFRKDDKIPSVLPRLFVSDRCQNTIRAFESYVYDPNREGDSEKVLEHGKDHMDCVRMMSDMESWKYQDPMSVLHWDRLFSNQNRLSPLC